VLAKAEWSKTGDLGAYIGLWQHPLPAYGEEFEWLGWAAGQDEAETGFERGSTRSFTFQVGRELGDLRRLHIQQVSFD